MRKTVHYRDVTFPGLSVVTNPTMSLSRPLLIALLVPIVAGAQPPAADLIVTNARTTTRVLDLQGQTVIPGMIDAHVHSLGLGTALRTVHDIVRVPNEFVLRTPVLAGYLGGKLVYERGPAQ
jgi:hypothetical protein